MRLWPKWLGAGRLSKRERQLLESEADEKLMLYREICQAHQDWEAATEKLNYVREAEQIDYVIYLQEAAEKRYEMLLKQAKRMELNVLELDRGVGKKPVNSGRGQAMGG